MNLTAKLHPEGLFTNVVEIGMLRSSPNPSYRKCA
jgi:hypothetical protein